MKRFLFCIAGCIMAAGLMPAQDDKPMVEQMLKHWRNSKDLSLAVAQAMPEESYSFKATDAEMSFGEQINHIAAANGNYCSGAIGTKSPFVKPENPNNKATAIKNLTEAYDYCITGLSAMSDKALLDKVTRGQTVVSKFELFWGGFTHAAHHRGQAEVYLRLKGVTPPSYKF